MDPKEYVTMIYHFLFYFFLLSARHECITPDLALCLSPDKPLIIPTAFCQQNSKIRLFSTISHFLDVHKRLWTSVHDIYLEYKFWQTVWDRDKKNKKLHWNPTWLLADIFFKAPGLRKWFDFFLPLVKSLLNSAVEVTSLWAQTKHRRHRIKISLTCSGVKCLTCKMTNKNMVFQMFWCVGVKRWLDTSPQFENEEGFNSP